MSGSRVIPKGKLPPLKAPPKSAEPIYTALRKERVDNLTELAGIVTKSQREYDKLLESWPR